MSKVWVFDAPHTIRINEARKTSLDQLLQSLSARHDVRTVLDAGCGTGFFGDHLFRLGLQVTGFDARFDNIVEARSRHPGVVFHVGNVEDVQIREMGRFDCVLCFGLLYHLENPFLAIRNLHALTEKTLILESMIMPGPGPVATLMSEKPGEDQGLHYIAFVPSDACLVKMLYRAGFPNVYTTATLPDHDDFHKKILHRRRRTMLVASRVMLDTALLRPVSEPQPRRPDIWQTSIARLFRAGVRLTGIRIGVGRRGG